jgi:hypothetical protein
MQETEIKAFYRNSLRNQRDIDAFRNLLKTSGGRLSGGGRALLKEALQAGMSHAKLARLFDITPAAVAYHDQ